MCDSRGVQGRRPAGVEGVNMSRYLFGGILAAAMLAAGSVQAHHSFAAEFDAAKPITLKGIEIGRAHV